MFDQMYEKLLEDAVSMKEDTIFYRHHIAYIKNITRYNKIGKYAKHR